jgi:excisionase family DNA binding protein
MILLQGWQVVETEHRERLEKVLEEGDMQLNRVTDKRLCITVPEGGEMLGISRNFGYELVKQGQLPVIRFGKRLLIPRVALERMLEEGLMTNNIRRE